MSDSLLERYGTRRAEPRTTPEAEGEGADDLGAFGWFRGIRDRCIMLEVRHRDGNISAFGYAWLESATFDPSEGIVLRFGSRTVKLIGHNLNAEIRPNVRLWAGILRHRVPWVQDADRTAYLQTSATATVIEEVRLT